MRERRVLSLTSWVLTFGRLMKRTAEQAGTILLVDDEEMILEVGQKLLEAMGYQVLVAKDGKEAIRVHGEYGGNIDIVVLDMLMPNMGGRETFDRIKERNPEIKVLLSSGLSVDGEPREILKRGCNGFIQKPYTMRQLSEKLEEVCAAKQKPGPPFSV
jgi:CheY-like chemotaxis protein